MKNCINYRKPFPLVKINLFMIYKRTKATKAKITNDEKVLMVIERPVRESFAAGAFWKSIGFLAGTFD